MALTPRPNVMKNFMAVIYEFSPVRPFQTSLMFAGKARAYLSEAPFR
jgi:hypothetical protein